MARNLTEKQEAFLEALFGDARGNTMQAIKLAGYAEGTSSASIM